MGLPRANRSWRVVRYKSRCYGITSSEGEASALNRWKNAVDVNLTCFGGQQTLVGKEYSKHTTKCQQ